MHIHILGVCGTFMGSLAVLAKQSGHHVTGSDQGVYPPMSTQLEAQGIQLIEGYDPEQLKPTPDLVVIGNAMSRGNPVVEAVLNQGLPYCSGPQWLAENVLQGRWTLAVSGTHGKTTTSTMLAWILEYAGMAPGFLIGGVPQNFEASARLGDTPFFVVEADEYDSAFFDKRSKFVHYRPRTLIINNLEYDHADIFTDLASIQRQFHHLVRTVPGEGLIIAPDQTPSVDEVLEMGCWSSVSRMKSASDDSLEPNDWQYIPHATADGFQVKHRGKQADVTWALTGFHNIANGVAAMAAAHHVGVTLEVAAEALSVFKGVKRRMELLAEIGNVKVYDDFAHHPTAIKETLLGLRKKVGDEHIIALIEPRSNTMKMGVHQHSLLDSAEEANQVVWANMGSWVWLIQEYSEQASKNTDTDHFMGDSIEVLLQTTLALIRNAPAGKSVHLVIMSNGGFSGIHQQIITHLNSNLATGNTDHD
jgi:UDP-N-acetylmuramate: L-alanyl-gamma-D-glutamyl-meso-diaminopimelate ligase